MLAFAKPFTLLVACIHVVFCVNALSFRSDCGKNYVNCSPKGASTDDEPTIGDPALSSFYVELVNTVDSSKHDKRDLQLPEDSIRARSGGGHLCCMYLLSVLEIKALE